MLSVVYYKVAVVLLPAGSNEAGMDLRVPEWLEFIKLELAHEFCVIPLFVSIGGCITPVLCWLQGWRSSFWRGCSHSTTWTQCPSLALRGRQAGLEEEVLARCWLGVCAAQWKVQSGVDWITGEQHARPFASVSTSAGECGAAGRAFAFRAWAHASSMPVNEMHTGEGRLCKWSSPGSCWFIIANFDTNSVETGVDWLGNCLLCGTA